jgi:hypothetical protein
LPSDASLIAGSTLPSRPPLKSPAVAYPTERKCSGRRSSSLKLSRPLLLALYGIRFEGQKTERLEFDSLFRRLAWLHGRSGVGLVGLLQEPQPAISGRDRRKVFYLVCPRMQHQHPVIARAPSGRCWAFVWPNLVELPQTPESARIFFAAHHDRHSPIAIATTGLPDSHEMQDMRATRLAG